MKQPKLFKSILAITLAFMTLCQSNFASCVGPTVKKQPSSSTLAKALGIPLGVVGAAFLAVGAHDIYQRKQLEREIIRLNAMIANNDTDDMVKLPAEAPENHSAQLQGLQMEKERLEILLKQEQARNERATASASKLQRDIDSLTQQFLDRDAKCDELYGNLMHQRISLPHRIVIFVIYVCAC